MNATQHAIRRHVPLTARSARQCFRERKQHDHLRLTSCGIMATEHSFHPMHQIDKFILEKTRNINRDS